MNISGMVKLEYVGVFITGTDPSRPLAQTAIRYCCMPVLHALKIPWEAHEATQVEPALKPKLNLESLVTHNNELL